MIDIGSKASVSRVAKASGFIRLKPETLQKIKAGEVPEGDVLVVAQTAAILALKRTPELIPLTHQIIITGTDVIFKLEKEGIRAEVEVKSTGADRRRDGSLGWCGKCTTHNLGHGEKLEG